MNQHYCNLSPITTHHQSFLFRMKTRIVGVHAAVEAGGATIVVPREHVAVQDLVVILLSVVVWVVALDVITIHAALWWNHQHHHHHHHHQFRMKTRIAGVHAAVGAVGVTIVVPRGHVAVQDLVVILLSVVVWGAALDVITILAALRWNNHHHHHHHHQFRMKTRIAGVHAAVGVVGVTIVVPREHAAVQDLLAILLSVVVWGASLEVPTIRAASQLKRNQRN